MAKKGMLESKMLKPWCSASTYVKNIDRVLKTDSKDYAEVREFLLASAKHNIRYRSEEFTYLIILPKKFWKEQKAKIVASSNYYVLVKPTGKTFSFSSKYEEEIVFITGNRNYRDVKSIKVSGKFQIVL